MPGLNLIFFKPYVYLLIKRYNYFYHTNILVMTIKDNCVKHPCRRDSRHGVEAVPYEGQLPTPGQVFSGNKTLLTGRLI